MVSIQSLSSQGSRLANGSFRNFIMFAAHVEMFSYDIVMICLFRYPLLAFTARSGSFGDFEIMVGKFKRNMLY